jgi:hypothetical protein
VEAALEAVEANRIRTATGEAETAVMEAAEAAAVEVAAAERSVLNSVLNRKAAPSEAAPWAVEEKATATAPLQSHDKLRDYFYPPQLQLEERPARRQR